MAAAKFIAVAKFVGANKQPFDIPFTVSDVAAEFWKPPSGETSTVLPTGMGGAIYMVDILASAAGTDTTKSEIWVNEFNTGRVIQHGANLATGVNRQFAGSPVGIKEGARLQIIQRA